MISREDLKKLLREFNEKGYSDPNSKYIDNGKNGKVLKLNIGEYSYEDEYYGGEPYCGNETIWENGIDIFRCVYWGKVVDGVDFGSIYGFLREALSKGPDGELVHRGPTEYTNGDFRYTNEIVGDIFEFRQVERIYLNDTEVYTAYFIGGRINVRK